MTLSALDGHRMSETTDASEVILYDTGAVHEETALETLRRVAKPLHDSLQELNRSLDLVEPPRPRPTARGVALIRALMRRARG